MVVGTSVGFVTTGWCHRSATLVKSSLRIDACQFFFLQTLFFGVISDPPNCVSMNNWCWLKKHHQSLRECIPSHFVSTSLSLHSLTLPPSSLFTNLSLLITFTHNLSLLSLSLPMYFVLSLSDQKEEDLETQLIFSHAWKINLTSLHSMSSYFSCQSPVFRIVWYLTCLLSVSVTGTCTHTHAYTSTNTHILSLLMDLPLSLCLSLFQAE